MLPILEAFKPVAAESRSVTVADRIVEAVATGHLLPGQRLVEQEIADRFAVSRVPLREAMKTLCAQGILVAEPHRGTRVAPIGEAWAASVRRSHGAGAARVPRRRGTCSWRSRSGPPARGPDRRDGAERRRGLAAGDQGRPRVPSGRRRGRGRRASSPRLWETLARHVLIVFGLETRPDMVGVAPWGGTSRAACGADGGRPRRARPGGGAARHADAERLDGGGNVIGLQRRASCTARENSSGPTASNGSSARMRITAVESHVLLAPDYDPALHLLGPGQLRRRHPHRRRAWRGSASATPTPGWPRPASRRRAPTPWACPSGRC